jgi:copper(I)-binding protein
MFSRGLIWLVLLGLAAPVVAADLEVKDPRLRQLLPGQNKTAGYFDITNNGPAAVTLVGAASDAAQAIEFHRIVHDGNIVRMRRAEKVVVAPGETVRFQPGGLHLMVFGISLLAQHTKIELLTDTGARIATVFRRVPLGVE